MGAETIAVTVWGDRVSPLFDVAREAVVLSLCGGAVVARFALDLPAGSGEAKLAELAAHGVGVLLCGAVSQPLAEHAAALGMRVQSFVAGDVEAVVAAYLKGELPSPALSMPGRRAGGRRRGPAAASRGCEGRGRNRRRGGGEEGSSTMPVRRRRGPAAGRGE